MTITMRFPEGKKKAFTLSYDDGHRCDLRFLDIINKYKLKCTFNVNMGLIPDSTESTRLTKGEYSAYEGHEIATHGYTHPVFSNLSGEAVTYEICRDRAEAEALLGRIVRGHAYAYGDYDEKSVEILKNACIAYARTTKASGSFDLPENWLTLHPTCHHSDERLFSLIDKFLEQDPKYKPFLFYVWGHTYEFDFNKERNNWDYADEFCKRISGHTDTVWYATNLEICDYVTAFKSLIFSMDTRLVRNPACTDVYIGIGSSDTCIKIGAGETVKL